MWVGRGGCQIPETSCKVREDSGSMFRGEGGYQVPFLSVGGIFQGPFGWDGGISIGQYTGNRISLVKCGRRVGEDSKANELVGL